MRVIGECRVLDVWACAYATTTSTSAIDIQKKGRGGGGGGGGASFPVINQQPFVFLLSSSFSAVVSDLAGDADILRTHEVFPAVFVWETSESACTFVGRCVIRLTTTNAVQVQCLNIEPKF